MASYRVLAGIDYPPNKRVEIGDVVTDLPGSAIRDLLAIGAIESTDKKSVTKDETIVVDTPSDPAPSEPAPSEDTSTTDTSTTTTTEETTSDDSKAGA